MVEKRLFLICIVLGLMLIGFVSAWSLDMTSPTNSTYDTKVNQFSWGATGINSSDIDSCWYTLDSGVTNTSIANCSDGIISTFIDSNEDSNDWTVYANDSLGTVESDSVSFWVDSIAPAITINTPNAIDYFSTLTLNFDVDIFEVNPTSDADFAMYTIGGAMRWFWAYGVSSGANSIIDSANPMPSDGTYTFNVTATDTVGHSSTAGRVVVMDSVPPVASIDNPSNGSLHNNGVSVETSATDNLAGIDTLEIEIDGSSEAICATDTCDYTWDTSVVADGWHEINATATDKAGNVDETSIVVETDNTPPVITLVGSNPQVIEVFDPYSEQGATAVDVRDGNLNASIVIDSSAVNVNVLGSYVVTYTVSDIVGNVAQENRTVNIVDTTAPVLSLIGSNPIQVEYNTSYVDQGATANDNYDGDISGSVVVDDSLLDVNVIGNYTVFYNVNDSSGNSALTINRTVEVIDSTSPIISLIGTNPQVIEVNAAYVEQGASASDNYDGDISGSIVIDSSSVNVNVVGIYTVYYNVSDTFGNSAGETRTVNVVDTTAPVITILGSNPITIERMSTYTDAGATADDSYDGNLTVNITVTSDVNENVAGSYTVEYFVEDSNGNNATEIRNVTVEDTITPTITIYKPVFNTTYTNDVISLDVSSDESINWKYTVDNGVTNVSFSPNTTMTLGNGNYNLWVYVSDVVGNENSTNVSFTVNKPAPVYSGGGGGGSSGSSCDKRWNCTDWTTWSVCSDSGLQERSCIEYERVDCGDGMTEEEVENLVQTQSCSFKIVQNSEASTSDSEEESTGSEEPVEEAEISGITGGVIGFARTRTGIMTVISLLAVLGAWGAVHVKRRQLRLKTN